jgi:hypothetical protein
VLAVMESMYNEYWDVFPVIPLMTPAEIQAVLDLSKSATAKSFKPESFLDNSSVWVY